MCCIGNRLPLAKHFSIHKPFVLITALNSELYRKTKPDLVMHHKTQISYTPQPCQEFNGFRIKVKQNWFCCISAF